MNKKVMLLIPVLLGVIFLSPLISAADPAWFNMTLTDFTNSTTGTNNISFTVSVAAVYNVTNVTCYYNSSGGAQYPNQNATFLDDNINTSTGDTSFSIVGTISSESSNLNMTCVLANDSDSAGVLPLAGGNSTISARRIIIDGTAPTLSLALDIKDIGVRDPVLVTWTVSDSSSKIQYYWLNITTPDSQKCPTIASTSSSSTTSSATNKDSLVDDQTACAGDYTVNLTAADYSGNLASTSLTFTARLAGKTKGGSNTLGGADTSTLWKKETLPLGETGTNIAILLILGGALYLFFKRKK